MGRIICQKEKGDIGDSLGDYTNELNAMRWSFSRCHGFEGCRYEWYLCYLQKNENEQNFYAAFGKFCHDVLEKVLKNEITAEESLHYYLDNYDENVIAYDVAENTREKYFYLGMSYFETLDFKWLKDYEILGVEKKCLFEINGKNFVGYIDLLIRHKETEEIIIVDHKSSEYPIGKKGGILKKKIKDYDSYKKQLYLYSKAIIDEYGVEPSAIWWNYFKEKQWLKLPFIKQEYETSLKWATELISDVYKEEDFLPNLEYFYCNNLCGFRNSCDYKTMGGE